MLSKNEAGHVQSPPLISGLTPKALLVWYQQQVGFEAYRATLEDFGRDTLIALAIPSYSRERFFALTRGERPKSETETALYQAVVDQEQPFSLVPVGQEDDPEWTGCYPYLFKQGAHWHWGLADVTSPSFESAREADTACTVLLEELFIQD